MRLPRLVLLLFLGLQACDGLFTYVAIHAEGLSAEGNVILSTWMALVGPAVTLVTAKSIAALAGVFVYVRGFTGTLTVLTGFYLAAAIGPWLYVYSTWP